MPDDDILSEAGGDISRETVQHRVDDWLKRLGELFESNTKWARQQGWGVDETGRLEMNEELMQRFGVAPAEQPIQRLDRPSGGYALFRPKGLWVIGANGRIDLYTANRAFVIVDRAESGQPPQWTLFRFRPEGVPYDPILLNELA